MLNDYFYKEWKKLSGPKRADNEKETVLNLEKAKPNQTQYCVKGTLHSTDALYEAVYIIDIAGVFYIFLLVDKSSEKTIINNMLVNLSELSGLCTLSVALSPELICFY